MRKKYKWVDAEIKEIKDINTKNPKRLKKMLSDYEKQGWTDMDTWSLDCTFAKFMLPRLKRFKEIKNGYPSNIDDNPAGGYSKKAESIWNKIVDEMIEGFQLMADGKQFGGNDVQFKKMNRSLDLFREHFFSLWW